jgi:hypothetical protein
MVGYMFVEDTDKIIIADLYWENYDLVFAYAYNARLRFFNLFKNQGFDVDSFRAEANKGPVGKKSSS